MMPIFCPCCGSKMHTDIDKPYYNIHKKCLNCVVEFEHELRVAGLYDAYEARIINSDIDGFIDDFTKFISFIIFAPRRRLFIMLLINIMGFRHPFSL